MFPNVPNCSQNSPEHENKGLTFDREDVVTHMYPQLCELTPLQTQALTLRLRGEPVGRIAKRLQLTRHTISRWCLHHPAFVAELNKRQDEVLAESTLVYSRLLRKSFGLLKNVLEEEGPEAIKVALSMVNGPISRKLLSREIGPTDEIGVINQMALNEQRTWEPKDGYMEVTVHQEYANRLAQLNFEPQPAPPKPPRPEAAPK